jgi:LacI family transcriptional regulator
MILYNDMRDREGKGAMPLKQTPVLEASLEMASAVTIRDVARKARVSLSSVSRVLTEHPDVSKEMRHRVLSAAGSLGYEPHFIAQSLRRGVTHTLGFLIGDISNPVFADVIRGAEDFARAKGYAVMLTNSEGNPALDAEHLRLFLKRRVDGIMLSTAETGSPEVARALTNPTVPFVVLDRDTPPNSRVSTVYGDHAAGMREATAHLINRGHRGIAMVSGSHYLKPARERIEGFRQAFRDAGLTPKEDLIRIGTMRPEVGREETVRLLSLPEPPTAIIAGSNRLMTGVLEGIHQANLTVGRDLALVGCDDVDLARLYTPAISVVVRDQYRMGQVACELLLERLATPDAPIRSVTLPTRFVARASSDFAWPVSGR